jgi:alginate export protein
VLLRACAVRGIRSLAEGALVSVALLVGAAARADESPPAPAAAATFEVPPVEIEGPFGATIRLEASERVRGELVDWFETPPNGAVRNDDYRFLGSRFQFGVRVKRDPVEIFVQFQDSLLYKVPDHAPGPGGSYFANTPETYQQEPMLRNAWLRWTDALTVPGLQTTLGRQLYRDGLETPLSDPTLAWLQKNRCAERLVGPFDYTQIGRSFDGGQVAYENQYLNTTAFGFVPTWGGYEINGNPEISQVAVAGFSATLKEGEALPGTSTRLFYLYYNDHRDIVFLDPRPLAVRAADHRPLNLHTVGGQLLHVEPLGPGKADFLLWAAGQLGDWQSLEQRAWAYALEAGYQLPEVWARPWLRVGVDQSSGTADPSGQVHGTFFQILPTARLYAQFPFFNLMNNMDTFVQLLLQPHAMVSLRTDLHWLRVTQPNDFLYAGGGATSSTNFGYTGTPTGGAQDVGYLLDTAITFTPTRNLTLYLYYGHVFGRGVIANAYVGKVANYGYAELTLGF